MLKTSRAKVWAVLSLVGFLNLFLFHRIGSVATVLVFGAYLAFVLVVFGVKQHLTAKVLIVAFLLFTWVMLFVANLFSRTLFIFATLILTSGAVYFLGIGKNFAEDTQELILVPLNLGLDYLGKILEVSEQIITGKIIGQVPNKARNITRLLVGIGIGLPIVGILLVLLSSGDPVFKYFLGNIFSWKFWMRPTVHVIFSVIMLLVFLPLGLLKVKKYTEKYLPKEGAWGTEIGAVVVMVAGVLGTFLAVQWKYVFVKVAAETSLSKFGVATYSEYVNRGFLEFILVAIIVYVVAKLGIWAWQKSGKKWLWVMGGGLLVEFGVFLISMLRRIYLYEQFHGWSLARIYGGIFVIWVGGMVIFLASRYLTRRNLLALEMVWTLLVIGGVGIFNAEHFVATTHPPTVNRRVDYVYLSRLSPDGYVGWKMAYTYATAVLNQDYPKNKLIDGEQRREIAYAYRIINQLEGNESDLKRQFETGDWWDKLLSWNYTEGWVYKKMKTDIPSGELEKLDKSAQQLWDRIYEQPEGERSVDIDVSYDSPLL